MTVAVLADLAADDDLFVAAGGRGRAVALDGGDVFLHPPPMAVTHFGVVHEMAAAGAVIGRVELAVVIGVQFVEHALGLGLRFGATDELVAVGVDAADLHPVHFAAVVRAVGFGGDGRERADAAKRGDGGAEKEYPGLHGCSSCRGCPAPRTNAGRRLGVVIAAPFCTIATECVFRASMLKHRCNTQPVSSETRHAR